MSDYLTCLHQTKSITVFPDGKSRKPVCQHNAVRNVKRGKPPLECNESVLGHDESAPAQKNQIRCTINRLWTQKGIFHFR